MKSLYTGITVPLRIGKGDLDTVFVNAERVLSPARFRTSESGTLNDDVIDRF